MLTMLRSISLGILFLTNLQILHADTFYVSIGQSCASDDNSGMQMECTTLDGPFKSITKAVETVSDGDTILIGEGMYFEKFSILTVQDLVIMPYGDGMVTISGAMQEYTVADNGLWTYEGKRYSIYHQDSFSVYYSAYLPQYTPNLDKGPNELAQRGAVDDKGKRLWVYADSVLFTERHVKAASGEGVYYSPDKIFISFEDPLKNPNDVTLYISQHGNHINVFGAKVKFDGGPDHLLTIDHSGRVALTAQAGGSFDVRRVNFRNGQTHLYATRSAGACIVENCDFFGGRDSLWSWGDVKHCYGNPLEDIDSSGCSRLPDASLNPKPIKGIKTNENSAIDMYTEAMCIVRGNRIHSVWNGITVTASNALVENNKIWNVQDEAIATKVSSEDFAISNVIVRWNWIWDAFTSHSGATIHPGPVYLYENIFCSNKDVLVKWDFVNDEPGIIWKGKPMKYWGKSQADSSRSAIYYYNTFFGTESPLRMGGACSVWSSSNVSHTLLFNNVFLSENEITIDMGRSIDSVIFRSNLMYTSGNPEYAYTCWEDKEAYAFMPPMPAGWTHNLEADPEFVGGELDSVDTYFQLDASSPGRVINGFTLESIPSHWPGADELNNERSNVGALEFNPPLNIDLNQSRSAIKVWPNPANKEIWFYWPDIDSAILQAEIISVTGKRIKTKRHLSGVKQGSIDLLDLTSGIYFLKLILESQQSETVKFVKW